MSTVVSCAGCERFVRTTDPECPFCGAARTPRTVSLRRSELARAAIVALALTGCGGGAAPVYGGPPPETPSPEGSSTTEGAETETPELEAEEESEPNDEEFEESPPVPIYGAPAPAPD